ncbi:hypothetical protein [Streptomyces sp. 5-10]|uniref:hypothetical protein n=1 Tax=Streptomyces sp. 5-10 TaxID=878925 RepID=UPI00168AA202|nr:hypothetical protein [Streptomyces sp. 5-10]MBD3004717.1 hypothetical protein [Streptomyces sp. 5-10]
MARKLSCSSVAYRDGKAKEISPDRILDCLWGENLSKRAIWLLTWLHFKADGTYMTRRQRGGVCADETYFRELECASLVEIENAPDGEVHVTLL